MVRYPEAVGADIHFAPPHGYVRIYLKPGKFLEYCPPLYIVDIEEDSYIRTLADHIIDGYPLDPPELGFHRYHDGRHRASAAMVAGVEWIPVQVDPDLAEHLLEIEEALITIPNQEHHHDRPHDP